MGDIASAVELSFFEAGETTLGDTGWTDVAPTQMLVLSGDTAGPTQATQVEQITLNPGGTFTLQQEGTLTTDAGFIVTEGATLNGSGEIVGDVSNAGSIQPGNSPGTIEIDGDYTQTGTFGMELERVDLYDQLIVSGHADVAGSIDLIFLDGFTPQLSDTFDAIKANSIYIDPSFDLTSVMGWAFSWQVVADATGQTLRLTVLDAPPTEPVPLPAAAWGGMALMGILGVSKLRRRRD